MNFQTNSICNGPSAYSALYLKNNSVIINTTISSVRSLGEVRLQILANVSRELANQNKENRLINRLQPANKQPLKPRKLFGPRSRESIQGYIDSHIDAMAFLEMVEGVTRELTNRNKENEQK